MSNNWRKWLFYVAALYDAILGLAFIFAWPRIFQLFEVTPPNHGGYVQFPAFLLIIFAFMFLRIAQDPDGNRELIAYGMGLKVAYSGLVFWYQLTAGVPFMWIPWAWIDVVFLILFVVARQPAAVPSARPVHG